MSILSKVRDAAKNLFKKKPPVDQRATAPSVDQLETPEIKRVQEHLLFFRKQQLVGAIIQVSGKLVKITGAKGPRWIAQERKRFGQKWVQPVKRLAYEYAVVSKNRLNRLYNHGDIYA